MKQILEALLNSLWQTAAITTAAWLLLKFTPRINAATRYAVWWAVLAVVVMLPVVTGTGAGGRKSGALGQGPEAGASANALASASQRPGGEQSGGARRAASPPGPRPLSVHAGDWPARVFAAWSLVGVLLFVRIVWSYGYLRRIKRNARSAPPELRRDFDAWLLTCRIPRKVRLLVSNDLRSPLAAGFLHPAVILPETLLGQFTPPDLDHVLLHELAHIARRDDWTNLAARLAGAVLALHPVAAWVLNRIHREREIACDDWVVDTLGDARPYAASLARLFEVCRTQRSALLATGMAESASHLGDRIEMLVRRGREFTPRPSPPRVAGMAFTMLAFVAAGARMPRWIVFSNVPARSMQAPVVLAAGTGGSFLAGLVAAGYGDLTVDEIVSLKDHGISADFLIGVSQSGWSKLLPRELIDLHSQGVEPSYMRTMREAGLRNLALPEVIRLKQHGVHSEYVREIHGCGLGPYSAAEVIDFSTHGVPPELFCALRDAGFTQASPREIVEAKNQGLRPQHLHEAAKFGAKLTLRQVVKLKQAGVI